MSSRTESKAEKDRQKQLQDKCQELLKQMLSDDDNKYCVDCDAKGPRWASWNLGVFLCIRCAGIHRNLGVHISKVKSVNLDSWTPEQVVSIQQMGNSRARAVYEATLPDSWRRPQTDSSLETFIRAKYQHKRYIAKEWVPPPLPKVDWNKELDEEADRQKKKKKEKQSSAALPPIKKAVNTSAVRVPAIPKPMSSPKSSRSVPSGSEETKQSSAIDLLGLSNPASEVKAETNGNADDVFSSFLSAPPAPINSEGTNTVKPSDMSEGKGRSAEEDSFFNQPAPTNEPKKPLSKDSILALYASQSAHPPSSTFPGTGMFPVNTNMGFNATSSVGFPAQPGAPYPAANVGSFGGASQGGFPPAQFGNGLPMQQPTQMVGAPPNGSNPFFGMSMGMMPPQGFPVQHGINGSKPSGDLLGDLSLTDNSSNNLPQQMAGLNLGQTIPGNVAPNFSALSGAAMPNMTPPNFMNASSQPVMGQTFTTHLWQ